MITQMKWAYSKANIKKVAPKQELFQILSQVHSQFSHRGHKCEKVASRNYAEISQQVNASVKMCLLHA